MEERYEKETPPQSAGAHVAPPGEKHYVCNTCREKYDLTEARQRMLACCGQPLLKTEVQVLGTPEPFGP
jgi:hypothetical protein